MSNIDQPRACFNAGIESTTCKYVDFLKVYFEGGIVGPNAKWDEVRKCWDDVFYFVRRE
jgi:hypothetical protein